MLAVPGPGVGHLEAIARPVPGPRHAGHQQTLGVPQRGADQHRGARLAQTRNLSRTDDLSPTSGVIPNRISSWVPPGPNPTSLLAKSTSTSAGSWRPMLDGHSTSQQTSCWRESSHGGEVAASLTMRSNFIGGPSSSDESSAVNLTVNSVAAGYTCATFIVEVVEEAGEVGEGGARVPRDPGLQRHPVPVARAARQGAEQHVGQQTPHLQAHVARGDSVTRYT